MTRLRSQGYFARAGTVQGLPLPVTPPPAPPVSKELHERGQPPSRENMWSLPSPGLRQRNNHQTTNSSHCQEPYKSLTNGPLWVMICFAWKKKNVRPNFAYWKILHLQPSPKSIIPKVPATHWPEAWVPIYTQRAAQRFP